MSFMKKTCILLDLSVSRELLQQLHDLFYEEEIYPKILMSNGSTGHFVGLFKVEDYVKVALWLQQNDIEEAE